MFPITEFVDNVSTSFEDFQAYLTIYTKKFVFLSTKEVHGHLKATKV